ncbi:MAG: response regulator transcription factor [Phycisphaerales bacterium]|nr:MAG: response regulator transcription factor [Phycisphaerales bacterium]
MSRESPRILLADPQTASRHALQVRLEDAGYTVDTVASGSDVILMCDVDPPDILILDVHLPDMDGFEVCEYVRHETRDLDLTVIVLTEPTDEMTRSYLGPMVDFAGGDYFLAKPCDSKLLIQLLDDLSDGGDQAHGAVAADSRPASCGRPRAHARLFQSVDSPP